MSSIVLAEKVIIILIMATEDIRIGTISWKYKSWQGLVYPEGNDLNFLRTYSGHFSTVEIDQWFWSLFKENIVVLPKAEVVREYAESVPPGFIFSIKVPNSITLTHFYNHRKKAPLIPNPYFFSTELMGKFLRTLEPLGDHIGPLIFQFEYLNRNKMASLGHFLDMLEVFVLGLPEGYRYCIEIRNPNYLKSEYFEFLADHHVGPVFLQGYFMPSILEVYEQFKDRLSNPVVLRLLGMDRRETGGRKKKVWDRIVKPRDDELMHLKHIVSDLRERRHQVFINVKNDYEGCAPLTIERLKTLLSFE